MKHLTLSFFTHSEKGFPSAGDLVLFIAEDEVLLEETLKSTTKWHNFVVHYTGEELSKKAQADRDIIGINVT